MLSHGITLPGKRSPTRSSHASETAYRRFVSAICICPRPETGADVRSTPRRNPTVEVWKPRKGAPEGGIRPADGQNLGTGNGVLETQERGMEEPLKRGAAIHTVAHDWAPEFRQVDTNLMLLARLEPDEESRTAPIATDHPPVRAGTFGPVTECRRIARMQAPHLVGTAIGFDQPSRDDTGVRAAARRPLQDRHGRGLDVQMSRGATPEQPQSLREHEEPGGGFVQPVNQDRFLVGARKVFVNGGPCRRSRSLSRCHREKSRGLVDHEEMVVFVDDLDGVRRRGRRHLGPERHVSAFRNLRIRTDDGAAIHGDALVREHLPERALRSTRMPCREDVEEPGHVRARSPFAARPAAWLAAPSPCPRPDARTRGTRRAGRTPRLQGARSHPYAARRPPHRTDHRRACALRPPDGSGSGGGRPVSISTSNSVLAARRSSTRA